MPSLSTVLPRRRGFTLIELLVVIAIIALLIGILLPSLGSARESGRQIKCATAMRNVAQAVTIYSNSYKGLFPASYLYAADPDPQSYEWNLNDQFDSDPPNGYIHWSYLLFDEGNVPEDAFRCPTTPSGGAPRTNPGGAPEDVEPGQSSPLGPNVFDRQVRRLAFTGNDAIFPRNKMRPNSSPRTYRFVNASEVDGSRRGAGQTILLTEFAMNNTWTSIATTGSDTPPGGSELTNWISKSHRPVTPFINEALVRPDRSYTLPPTTTPAFRYPRIAEGQPERDQWRQRKFKKNAPAGAIADETFGLTAVGRHHPGGDALGGSANFAFVDGHVENTAVTETVIKQQWGDRYFSLTGNNKLRED